MSAAVAITPDPGFVGEFEAPDVESFEVARIDSFEAKAKRISDAPVVSAQAPNRCRKGSSIPIERTPPPPDRVGAEIAPDRRAENRGALPRSRMRRADDVPAASPCHARNRVAGFSLVEMLVVLAILGLAVGIGAPSLQGIIPSQRLKTAVEAIAGEVALLRIEAQRSGRATSVVFDEETHRFVSSRPGAPMLSMTEWRVLVETGAAARVGPGEIRFLPEGGSTGGRITLTGSGGTRILVVSRATGAVRRAEVAP